MRWKTLPLLLALALAAPLARAQPSPDPGLRARVRAQVRAAIVQKLVQAMQLDAPAQARFGAILERFDVQIAQLQDDNAAGWRELRQLSEAHRADDPTVNRIADRLLANRERIARLELDRDREVRRTLTTQQYGRLILAWPVVNHTVKREMWKALAGQAGLEDGNE